MQANVMCYKDNTNVLLPYSKAPLCAGERGFTPPCPPGLSARGCGGGLCHNTTSLS